MSLAQPTTAPATLRKLEAEEEEKATRALHAKRDEVATRAQRHLITDHFAAAPLGERVRDVELVVWF